MPNVVDNPELYEALVVTGRRSPGQVTLSSLERVWNWEIKEGDGDEGGTTTQKGKKIGKPKASFYLVKDDVLGLNEYEEWETFVPILKAANETKPLAALDVYHPDLAALDYGALQVESISGPTYDGKGGATYEVQFLEYRPRKPKGGTTEGSSSTSPGGGAAGGAAGGDANDPVKQAEQELDKERQEAAQP